MLSFLTTETDGRLISDRWLFWWGLVIFTIGQGMTGMSLEFAAAQRPIDYMHWMMLIGALLMVPFAVTMPRTPINRLASPLLIVGVAGIVGMAMIDFIVWSYGLTEARNAFIDHVRGVPVIWQPFIELGPGWIFGFGLCLPSLYDLNRAPLGALLVVVGGVMLPLGFQYYVSLGFPVIILGYALCFVTRGEAAPAAGDQDDDHGDP
ncbi:MAG: hypothetical protein HRU11_01095 [Parvularculaceae bacterium]|nr:hypothetical protein [Parvularculaceae bacterium]